MQYFLITQFFVLKNNFKSDGNVVLMSNWPNCNHSDPSYAAFSLHKHAATPWPFSSSGFLRNESIIPGSEDDCNADRSYALGTSLRFLVGVGR